MSKTEVETIKQGIPCSRKHATQKLGRITINRVGKPARANCPCRLQGGKPTGAKITEGSAIQRKASWKHGMRPKAILEGRRAFLEYILSRESFIDGLW
ncbi:hypothetical protein NEOC84_001307|nr:hypothetical protein [Neochlamydia sp. AcF84]